MGSTLREDIINAIRVGDKAQLTRLREKLKGERWISSFGKSIPIKAWLDHDNPLIKFVD